MDGGLFDVTGDTGHERITVLKVGVEVRLRVAKKSDYASTVLRVFRVYCIVK